MNDEKKNILIIGGDGYIGWPTAMNLSKKGHLVSVLDNFSKRRIEAEEGVSPLWPIPTLSERVKIWNEISEILIMNINDKFVLEMLNKLIALDRLDKNQILQIVDLASISNDIHDLKDNLKWENSNSFF